MDFFLFPETSHFVTSLVTSRVSHVPTTRHHHCSMLGLACVRSALLVTYFLSINQALLVTTSTKYFLRHGLQSDRTAVLGAATAVGCSMAGRSAGRGGSREMKRGSSETVTRKEDRRGSEAPAEAQKTQVSIKEPSRKHSGHIQRNNPHMVSCLYDVQIDIVCSVNCSMFGEKCIYLFFCYF